nr:hypothetical transcript [Hymenolepis microstoma]
MNKSESQTELVDWVTESLVKYLNEEAIFCSTLTNIVVVDQLHSGLNLISDPTKAKHNLGSIGRLSKSARGIIIFQNTVTSQQMFIESKKIAVAHISQLQFNETEVE